MIIGIGTDLVEMIRVAQNYAKHGDTFACQMLSDVEFEQFGESTLPIVFLAKAWAAKEAFVKALGTGFNKDITPHDIWVERDKHGGPTYMHSHCVKVKLDEMGVTKTHLTISDEQNYVIAFAILESSLI